MKALFSGSGVALVTPFTEEGVDFEAYKRLIERQIAAGTVALIVCGTTGEPSTMTEVEREATLAFALEACAGRARVVAGCGTNDSRETAKRCARAEKLGADATLVVTPYYNKTSQRGLIEHYLRAADAANLPMIAYNVPSRTGLNLLPETAARLCEHENVAGFKEASGDIAQAAQYARLCPNAYLYAGNDDSILPILALGGRGAISVAANVAPGLVKKLCDAWFAGDTAGSLASQMRALPLVKALFSDVNPIPVKAALARLGLCSERVRLPLVPMEASAKAALYRTMEAYTDVTGGNGRVF